MKKMARRYNKEGGNHLEQEGNRQKAMEDNDGRLHCSVDGQTLGEGEGEKTMEFSQRKPTEDRSDLQQRMLPMLHCSESFYMD